MILWIPLALILEGLLGTVWRVRWTKRGYSVDSLLSFPATALRLVIPTILAALVEWYYGSWVMSAAVGLLAWLGGLASVTDLKDYKIPSEPCWIIFGATTLLGLVTFTPAAFASALTAFLATIVIVFLLVVITRGGLGSGDARLFVAFSSMAWWFGFTPVLIGMLLASILQVFFRLLYLRKKTPAIEEESKDQESISLEENKTTSITDSADTDSIEDEDKPKTSKAKGYPFAPAIGLGYLIAAIFFGNPQTICAEWTLLIECSL